MPSTSRPAVRLLAAAALALAPATAAAQAHLTSPREQFGHEIGADYQLPDYRQMAAWWRKLDAESDRMQLVDIGPTAEGRRQLMAIVSSPANLRNLARYRGIAARLAHAEGLTEAQAHALARGGKAVVWIDGGLHANEVLGAQQLMETAWQLVSREDAETRRIRDDVVVLLVHANPDGMDLVSDWYMREPDPLKRSTGDLPRLYQKYIGHDDNRDFYASTQPETKNMNRVLFHQWFPQIVYNHHQTGPAGTVMFAPPFRDPFNYFFDPLIVTKLDLVGAAMHSRFVAENKPGVTMRSGAPYSTWWNGGLRTITYFHNMVGLLTETIGNPTPMQIPFVVRQQLPRADLPLPIAPQRWHFRQSIDYEVTANYAVLDLASRYRETFLYDIYRMGRESMDRGSRDSWTIHPKVVEMARGAVDADRAARTAAGGQAQGGDPEMRGAPDSAASARYWAVMHSPALRDPRGYVIPADQPDFPTATKFVNALLETGITVHRATAPFSVAGKRYPAGSFVVKTAQPFRPHVLDMFEPQDHPNDFPYPGAPPTPPYDLAGWTLAYQMGVRFDRVLDAFDGPFVKVDGFDTRPPAGVVDERSAAATQAYVVSPKVNDAFRVANRLLAAGVPVSRAAAPFEAVGRTFPAGSFVIDARAGRERVAALARELGVSFTGVPSQPEGAVPLRPVRVGLWDRYGGSIPSGWTRFVLEQFEFPFQVVYAPELDAGNLAEKYDVLIFPSDAIPERDRTGRGGMPDPASVPAEFRARIGNVSVARTVPALRAFLEQGGTVITVGGSTVLGRHLGLPVADALVERGPDASERHLPAEKFYIPGSVLRVRVDTTAAAAWGMDGATDVMFDESPAFRLLSDGGNGGVRRLAWYDGPEPLRSGWAWGQKYLDGATAAAEADVGRGRLLMFGPEITFRAQPHGTFKFLFNGIYEAMAKPRAQ
ncbi:MAG TPA: M14 metallopeptidase family protein [Longimicrobiaceae bacterium]|jgi:hypothetical protein|nr:M14 metallopeptidase family protein [Longimicrobiaceae bacterium]